MRRILPAGLFVFLVAAVAIAQPSTIRPGDIRCPDCGQSGQKPATAVFDASQIEFVANPASAFDGNQTIRFSVIARVLQPAPLILEALDSRIQTLDRNMRVVDTGSRDAEESSGCVLEDPHQPVDLASKAVVSALRFERHRHRRRDPESQPTNARRHSCRHPDSDQRAQGRGARSVLHTVRSQASAPIDRAASSSIGAPKTASSRSCTTTAASITATART